MPLSYETVAPTGEPPLGVSVKLELVSVDAFIPREKVALTVVPVDTPVAPSAGDFEVTVGGPGGAVDGVTSIAATSGSSAEP